MRRAAAGALAALLLAGCGGTSAPPPPKQGNGPPLGSLARSGAGHRFYEIYEPAGTPRGTMLVLHGGAWKDRRGDARQMMTVAASAFRQGGWRVVNVSYSPGNVPGRRPGPRPMMRDVVAFYDQIHRAFPGPICAYGESAGGHLAAMLALERPALTCAILQAAPTDLPRLIRTTIPPLVPEIRQTFGSSRADLVAWSPALRWTRRIDRTPVFATAASNDKIVPAGQLKAFTKADPAADSNVLPGVPTTSPDAFPFMHSEVSRLAASARLNSLASWLDQLVPSGSGSAPSGDTGAGCADPRQPRWKLLQAGDAWQQDSTQSAPIFATSGCSGSGRWQDDGLSVWALPATAPLPAGSQASLTLRPGHELHSLSVEFRGFLARPQDWVIGLYAVHGGATTGVAGCSRGACRQMRLVSTGGGALLAPAGYRGNPDLSDTPPRAGFRLPAGTTAVSWRLQCVNRSGCSLAPVAGPGGVSLRARDPLGQPAIFSLYRVDVR